MEAASAAEARVVTLEAEKARPFFSGLGGAFFAGGADAGAGREGPFLGFFPCQETRVFSFSCPRCTRQADASSLREELARLKAHPSSVEKSFGLAFVPGRFIPGTEAGAYRTPRRRFLFPSEPSRSIPRRTVSAATAGVDPLEEKTLGPAAFFSVFFGSAELALRSAERALRRAERALRRAERAQCRAGT